MPTIRRRPVLRAVLAAACSALAGCGGLTDGRRAPVTAAEAPSPAPAAPSSGPTIGSGSVKVAVILPLTGPGQAASAATSLRNAADLAMAEFSGADLTLLVKDDRGTADGARGATAASLAEGAELIVGPLFAPAVAAAGTVARDGGRSVIAFSTDVGVASRGVYLLSFLPQSETARVIDYAAAQGRRSFAALIPDTVYGTVVEAEFREAAARRGARVAAIERYPAGQPGPAVQRLGPVLAGPTPSVDAIFIPAGPEDLPAVGTALGGVGFDPKRVKPLGTGLWSDPRTVRVPALAGGWYAAPDPAGFTTFAGRYRARFGSEPARIATLAYDAVSLAAALARKPAGERFTDATLGASSGFAGADGAFRFRADGTNERALAVNQVGPDGPAVVSPAPKVLGPPGT